MTATTPEAVSSAGGSPRAFRRRRPRVPSLLLTGTVGFIAVVTLALLGERIAGFDAGQQSLAERLVAPGTNGHLLGTDQLGRDLFARVVAGFRWSLPVGFVSVLIAMTIGTFLGIVAGWSDGLVRAALSRLMEVAIAFPYLVLAVAIIAVAGRGFWTLTVILGLVSWVSFARVVYVETLRLKEKDYVVAARLMGMPTLRLVATYVLRGLRPRLVVMVAFVFADLLVAEAALSFLGVGAPLGTPSWGNMLAASREHLFTAPWMLYAPAGAVVLVVLTANLIGDGLNQHWGAGVHQE